MRRRRHEGLAGGDHTIAAGAGDAQNEIVSHWVPLGRTVCNRAADWKVREMLSSGAGTANYSSGMRKTPRSLRDGVRMTTAARWADVSTCSSRFQIRAKACRIPADVPPAWCAAHDAPRTPRARRRLGVL